MGELLTLLHCRQIKVRDLQRLPSTDRLVLLRQMHTTPPAEATLATGQTTLSPPTTVIATVDPMCGPEHSSPKITKSGPPSISLVQTTSMKYNQAARRMDPSCTKKDLTTPCLLLSAQGSMLTTGPATVMYANLHLLLLLLLLITPIMLARHRRLMDK